MHQPSLVYLAAESTRTEGGGLLDDALGEAHADDACILCDLPQHRECQALNIGSKTADVLRQRLWQHVYAPLHQVCGRCPEQAVKQSVTAPGIGSPEIDRLLRPHTDMSVAPRHAHEMPGTLHMARGRDIRMQNELATCWEYSLLLSCVLARLRPKHVQEGWFLVWLRRAPQQIF